MQCFVLYYSKGTNTEEMNHVVSFMMLYLVCGHIVMKIYSSIQYVYFVLQHSLAINVQNGSTKED